MPPEPGRAAGLPLAVAGPLALAAMLLPGAPRGAGQVTGDRPGGGDSCMTSVCHSRYQSAAHVHAPVARGICGICHRSTDEQRHEFRLARAGSALCTTCHWDIHAAGGLHGGALPGGCDLCHDPHGSEHVAQLRQDVPLLCFGCHEETRRAVEDSRYGHSVTSAPGGCVECHDPHGSPLDSGLRDDPFSLCNDCHSTEIVTAAGQRISAVTAELESSRYLHGPARQGDCGGCHGIHGSDHPRLLLARYSPQFYAPFNPESYQLCFGCHPERKVLTERSTALTGFRNGDLNLHYLHVNKPQQGRTCRACHATHGSDQPKHVRQWTTFGGWQLPINFSKTESGGRCAPGCHRPRAYDRDAPVTWSDTDEQTDETDEAAARPAETKGGP